MNFHVDWTDPRISNCTDVVTNTSTFSEPDQVNTGFWPLANAGHVKKIARPRGQAPDIHLNQALLVLRQTRALNADHIGMNSPATHEITQPAFSIHVVRCT